MLLFPSFMALTLNPCINFSDVINNITSTRTKALKVISKQSNSSCDLIT